MDRIGAIIMFTASEIWTSYLQHHKLRRTRLVCRLDTRGKYDFELLDRNGKAGWDLARKLLRKRTSVNRGRLSAGQALRHRYFSPLG